MTELPPMYAYYLVRKCDSAWSAEEAGMSFGPCAFAVLLDELEKGNKVLYIKLRDHD
jgi:hypothetical protein